MTPPFSQSPSKLILPVICRYTFDTTLGVTLAVLLHRLLVRWAARRRAAPDPEAALDRFSWVQAVATCGDYGGLIY